MMLDGEFALVERIAVALERIAAQLEKPKAVPAVSMPKLLNIERGTLDVLEAIHAGVEVVDAELNAMELLGYVAVVDTMGGRQVSITKRGAMELDTLRASMTTREQDEPTEAAEAQADGDRPGSGRRPSA